MAESHNDHIKYYKKVGKRIRGDKRQSRKIRDLE